MRYLTTAILLITMACHLDNTPSALPELERGPELAGANFDAGGGQPSMGARMRAVERLIENHKSEIGDAPLYTSLNKVFAQDAIRSSHEIGGQAVGHINTVDGTPRGLRAARAGDYVVAVDRVSVTNGMAEVDLFLHNVHTDGTRFAGVRFRYTLRHQKDGSWLPLTRQPLGSYSGRIERPGS